MAEVFDWQKKKINLSEIKKEIKRLVKELQAEFKKKKIFLTAMESCTGGGFLNEFTNLPGASQVIKGGLIAYSSEQKVIFGVPKSAIKKYSVYSFPVAASMAKVALKKIKGSKIGVGITGVLTRADPQNPNKKVGEVYLSVVFGKKILERKFYFPSQKNRKEDKALVIWQALKMVKEICS